MNLTIHAANLLSKVEPHANSLEAAASKMEADGMGTAEGSGHAVHLRKMAASMRSDAARGVMPSSYHGSMMASAGMPVLAGAKDGNKTLEVAVNIMTSKGIEIPYGADGSVSTYALVKMMTDAGLSKERQTIVKASVLASGCRVVG
jgi:hypothetical protein